MQNDNTRFRDLIITVDDFGYNQAANQLIFGAVERGVIDQASTMVNMMGGGEALEYIAKKIQNSKLKSIQFGLHLNLTEGQPVGDPKTIPSLVDKNGYFIGWKRLISRSLIGQLRSQEVEKETRRQIEKLQTVVKPIPFLNSHHHLHLWPPIAQIIKSLCQEYEIKQVRAARKIWWPAIKMQQHGFKSLLIQLMAAKSIFNFQPVRRPGGLAIFNFFIDLDWAGQSNAARELIVSELPTGAELACHPVDFRSQKKLTKASTLSWLIERSNDRTVNRYSVL